MTIYRQIAPLGAAIVFAIGLAHASDTQEEANKHAAIDFYNALHEHDVERVLSHVGESYVEHNNHSGGGGRESVRGLAQVMKEKLPQARTEIKRAFADGDFVILHTKDIPVPSDRGTALVHFFRFKDGKIVEHWDVKQPIPETSANSNGML